MKVLKFKLLSWVLLILCLFMSSSLYGKDIEIKYFDTFHSEFTFYRFETKHEFDIELDPKILPEAIAYYEGHYKDGFLINGALISKSKILERYEFDSLGRIIQDEDQERICKWSYSTLIKEHKCFDLKGNFKSHFIFTYNKDGFINKSSEYDESGNIILFSIFDFEGWEESIYDSNGNFLRKEEMAGMKRVFNLE